VVAVFVVVGLLLALSVSWFLPLAVVLRYRRSGRDHFLDLRLRLGGLPWYWHRRWPIPSGAGLLWTLVGSRKAVEGHPTPERRGILAGVATRGRRRLAHLWLHLRPHDYARAAKALLSRARWQYARLAVGYGSGDPARTAVRVGALWGLLGMVIAAVSRSSAGADRFQFSVRPIYGRVCSEVDAGCIFTLRLGDIIRAGCSLLGTKGEQGCGNTQSRG